MRLILLIPILIGGLFWANLSWAQDEPQPAVGRKAAEKYFVQDKERIRDEKREEERESDELLMIQYGVFTSSNAYSWGGNAQVNGAGQSTFGLTFLLEQWHGMDLNARGDYITYSLAGSNAQKISLLPLLIYPRASTRFPLYFGAGGGLGVFTEQLSNASYLSIDYELLLGARFMDMYEGVGTFLEFAMKNHFLALSAGQFIGYSVSAGMIFNF